MVEMKTIAERSFRPRTSRRCCERLRTDPQYLFKNRQELIDYSTAALARAKAAAPNWFGLLPKADVRIEPYPAFREKNAPNEYNAPAEDGSRPALFYISAYQAEKKSQAGIESTAFHETIPGHHLQIAIALERKEIHPIGRYIFNSGYAEGWALYAERPGRRDEALFVRSSIGSACCRRRRSARRGWSSTPASTRSVGRGSRRSTTCSRTRPKRPDDVGVGDRPLHHLAGAGDRLHAGHAGNPAARDGRADRSSGRDSTSRRFTTACSRTAPCRSAISLRKIQAWIAASS